MNLEGAYVFSSSGEDVVWVLSGPFQFFKEQPSSFFFYDNDFFFHKELPFVTGFVHLFSKNDFLKLLAEQCASFDEKSEPSYEKKLDVFSYEQQFATLQKRIQEKSLKKGVPFATEVFEYEKPWHPFFVLQNAFKSFLALSSVCFYGYLHREKGFLGISPELMFEKKLNTLKTYALAGTWLSHQKPNEVKTSQLKKEHDFVVVSLEKELARFGWVTKEPMTSVALGKISHFKTPFSIKIKDHFDFEIFLKSIHPSPALGTFPKESGDHSKSWLSFVENFVCKRKEFCGLIGFSYEDFQLCVAKIRGIYWEKDRVFMSAGGGVVKQSVFEEEWQEIVWKLSVIKKYFWPHKFHASSENDCC